ncbi:hypothetical protein GCM10027188_12300 [Lysobacter humi (ex Lee et al. 2017)]
MHHRVDLALEAGVERLRAEDVGIDQAAPADRLPVAGQHVVEDGDFMAGACEREGRVRADIAGAAANEYVHGSLPF